MPQSVDREYSAQALSQSVDAKSTGRGDVE
jgi:hypothetical protein